MDYDVIVVGTRVAGSATAMLLARSGLRVLAVDRAHFPSDTLSTHQVQLPGVALLSRWGLIEPLAAAGTPVARTATFDAGPAVLHGAFPAVAGADGVHSPRRTLLDATLLTAARDAGAEVAEGFVVEGTTREGDRVTGIRGAARGGGQTRTLTAAVVVGADGKHSTVAKAVGAVEYRTRPALSGACYAYLADLPVAGGELYARPDRMVGLWPTNDGLTILFVAAPREEFAALRAGLHADLAGALAGIGELGERVGDARLAEHLRGTNDLPNTFRTPHGPGWALVGDAGLVMDPITGQGIGNALQDADALSTALVAGLGGTRPLEAALEDFRRDRDEARLPMYDLTCRLASFRQDRSGDVLFPAIARDPAQVSRFLGVLTGVVPVPEFFAPANLLRMVGVRGLARMLRARARPPAAARAVPILDS